MGFFKNVIYGKDLAHVKVPARIGQQDRGLEARDQAFIAVGRGVGESVERARVLDDPANVVQRNFG